MGNESGGATVDVLFLAHGRREFTEASFKALETTLDASHRLWVFTDGGELPEVSEAVQDRCAVYFDRNRYGGPVACMVSLLKKLGNAAYLSEARYVAKVDNDLIVCPGWLEACVDMMEMYKGVDLLGIEPYTPDTKLFPVWMEPMDATWRMRGVRPVSHIGGIGLFRRSAFDRFGLPTPNTQDGRFGFTEFQWANPGMVKAFMDPPLPVFLLDHLPFEPWRSLSQRYEAEGVQRRQWGEYDPVKHKALWEWWGDKP